MSTITINRPRVTASADVTLEDGAVLQVTVDRSASEIDILNAVKGAVRNENMRRSAVGGQPVRIPTDEELVPALAVFGRLADIPRSVDA